MQGFGSSSPCSTFGTDPEFIQARMFMSEKIYYIFLRRRQQTLPVDEMQRRRITNIVSRLEEGLFITAHSKEEYMNLNTLEIRLHDLIKCPWPAQYSVSPNPSTVDVDSEICRTRAYMKLKIFQRQLTQPVHHFFMDLATNLEEGYAHSMEEYMNMDTFKSRFANLFKFDSNSSPSSTTIATSGRSASGASDMLVTRDDSSVLTNVDNRNMLQTGGSFNRSDDTQFPDLHQQNALPPHMQNSSNPRLSNNLENLQAPPQMQNSSNPRLSNDLENLQARAFMWEKIYHFVQQRFPQPISEEQRRKISDIVRLLEDGLFRTSHTKEEYMNLETLENRLHHLIRHSQTHPQLSYSTSNFVNTQDIEYLLRELALD